MSKLFLHGQASGLVAQLPAWLSGHLPSPDTVCASHLSLLEEEISTSCNEQTEKVDLKSSITMFQRLHPSASPADQGSLSPPHTAETATQLPTSVGTVLLLDPWSKLSRVYGNTWLLLL